MTHLCCPAERRLENEAAEWSRFFVGFFFGDFFPQRSSIKPTSHFHLFTHREVRREQRNRLQAGHVTWLFRVIYSWDVSCCLKAGHVTFTRIHWHDMVNTTFFFLFFFFLNGLQKACLNTTLPLYQILIRLVETACFGLWKKDMQRQQGLRKDVDIPLEKM